MLAWPYTWGMSTSCAADPDPCRCPLCGGPNACAMATPGVDAAGPCWCVSAVFPQTLLDQVPPAAQGRACICPACVARVAEEKAAP